MKELQECSKVSRIISLGYEKAQQSAIACGLRPGRVAILALRNASSPKSHASRAALLGDSYHDKHSYTSHRKEALLPLLPVSLTEL